MTNGEGLAFDFPIAEYERAAAEQGERILAKALADAQNLAVECETVHVSDFPAEGILATAKAKNCDLIVMASHGRRGIARLLLGSQATRVVTLSTVPSWSAGEKQTGNDCDDRCGSARHAVVVGSLINCRAPFPA